MTILFNKKGKPLSLQVSNLKLLSSGDFKSKEPVLVKNITEDTVTLEVELSDMNGTYISTTIYPGWNPELVTGIKNVPENTLQIGN